MYFHLFLCPVSVKKTDYINISSQEKKYLFYNLYNICGYMLEILVMLQRMISFVESVFHILDFVIYRIVIK